MTVKFVVIAYVAMAVLLLLQVSVEAKKQKIHTTPGGVYTTNHWS